MKKQNRFAVFALIGVSACLAAGNVCVGASETNSTPSPTMESGTDHAAVQMCQCSVVKRVVRGVAHFDYSDEVITVSFSPPINPDKSSATVSTSFLVSVTGEKENPVIILELTKDSITLQRYQKDDYRHIAAFEIIEYN